MLSSLASTTQKSFIYLSSTRTTISLNASPFRADLLTIVAFPSLRRLDVGDCIHKEFLPICLCAPEKLEQLTCVAHQEESAGQGNVPPQILLLSSLQHTFNTWTTLYLFKLAELSHEDNQAASGLRWQFEVENDRAVLHDWAGFLKRISNNLVHLRFEDRCLAF